MTFPHESTPDLQDDARPAFVRFGMRHWRWSAVPLCIVLLLLIAPADNSAEMGRRLDAAQRELAAAKGQLDSAEREARVQAQAAAGAAAEQGLALKQASQANDALTFDLKAAQRAIENFKSKAVLAEDSRHSIAASLSNANQALEEERKKVEQFARELALARQVSDANKASADLAAVERADAVRDRQLAETTLKQTLDTLHLERARADAATHDLDDVRQQREAAKQLSADLGAALEQARENAINMAIKLTAARKAIDLAKAQNAQQTADERRVPKPRFAASPPASSDVQAARLDAQAKNKPKLQKLPKRALVATTIALPDALLPAP